MSDLLYIVRQIKKSNADYLMFILHSSEMMPGGSPTFDTEEKIEKLYEDLEILFEEISKDFEGISVADYGKLMEKRKLRKFR